MKTKKERARQNYNAVYFSPFWGHFVLEPAPPTPPGQMQMLIYIHFTPVFLYPTHLWTAIQVILVLHLQLKPTSVYVQILTVIPKAFGVHTSLQRALYSFLWFSVRAFQRWAKTIQYDFLATPLMCFTCSLQNKLYPVLKSYTYREKVNTWTFEMHCHHVEKDTSTTPVNNEQFCKNYNQ